MKHARYAFAVVFASVFGAGLAWAADEVAPDQPMTVGGVETVCTGTTTDERADPRWRDYSLRLEFVGKGGQFLGGEEVNVTGNGQSIAVHCADPWVLMKLPEGSYKISTDVPDAGHREMNTRVPAKGQAQIIVRFPDAGGGTDNLQPGKQAEQ